MGGLTVKVPLDCCLPWRCCQYKLSLRRAYKYVITAVSCMEKCNLGMGLYTHGQLPVLDCNGRCWHLGPHWKVTFVNGLDIERNSLS